MLNLRDLNFESIFDHSILPRKLPNFTIKWLWQLLRVHLLYLSLNKLIKNSKISKKSWPDLANLTRSDLTYNNYLAKKVWERWLNRQSLAVVWGGVDHDVCRRKCLSDLLDLRSDRKHRRKVGPAVRQRSVGRTVLVGVTRHSLEMKWVARLKFWSFWIN